MAGLAPRHESWFRDRWLRPWRFSATCYRFDPPTRGLAVWIWTNIFRICMAQRDETNYGTPGPPRPQSSVICESSVFGVPSYSGSLYTCRDIEGSCIECSQGRRRATNADIRRPISGRTEDECRRQVCMDGVLAGRSVPHIIICNWPACGNYSPRLLIWMCTTSWWARTPSRIAACRAVNRWTPRKAARAGRGPGYLAVVVLIDWDARTLF